MTSLLTKICFLSLPNEEIVCLRSDGYCGMVAYMFKKSFVRKLIPKLNKNFKSMPIDWIVDQTRGTEVIRIPKAYHHGIISSNGKKREATKTEAKMNAKCHMVDLPGHVHVAPRKVPRKIVQIFPYGHEFDMLKMKIQNNVEFTDEFIIIEGDKTFALERKPYYLDENIDQVNPHGKNKTFEIEHSFNK